jgi:alpha-amylase
MTLLQQQNPELRAALKDWLNWLSDDIGFDCWRFDFAPGYAPQYIQEYIKDTVGTDNTLNVAEFWTDGG